MLACETTKVKSRSVGAVMFSLFDDQFRARFQTLKILHDLLGYMLRLHPAVVACRLECAENGCFDSSGMHGDNAHTLGSKCHAQRFGESAGRPFAGRIRSGKRTPGKRAYGNNIDDGSPLTLFHDAHGRAGAVESSEKIYLHHTMGAFGIDIFNGAVRDG